MKAMVSLSSQQVNNLDIMEVCEHLNCESEMFIHAKGDTDRELEKTFKVICPMCKDKLASGLQTKGRWEHADGYIDTEGTRHIITDAVSDQPSTTVTLIDPQGDFLPAEAHRIMVAKGMIPNEFNVDVFIIPNSACSVEEAKSNYPSELQSELFISDDERMVQMWVTNDECENWDCHKNPFCHYGAFPSRFPASLFKGKKEGDVVDIVIGGATFHMKLAQTAYRYRSHGNFETVLASLVG